MLSKITNFIKSAQYHIFLAVCIILISIISFNVGKINALHKIPLTITENQNQNQNQKADIYSASTKSNTTLKQNVAPVDNRVVVSRASTTRKYHHVWCASASKIKEANKLWFNSAQEAEAVGYTLAGNFTK